MNKNHITSHALQLALNLGGLNGNQALEGEAREKALAELNEILNPKPYEGPTYKAVTFNAVGVLNLDTLGETKASPNAQKRILEKLKAVGFEVADFRMSKSYDKPAPAEEPAQEGVGV